MNAPIRRVTAAAGLAGSLIITLASALTALAYTGRSGQPFSPLNHFISELGEVGISEWAAVFNIGLIIGGLCLAIFMVGVAFRERGLFRWGFLAIGLVSGISGALVGVYPMNQLKTHTQVALLFFNTGWIAVALFSAYILVSRQSGYPRWLAILGAVCVVCFIVFLRLLNTTDLAGSDLLASPDVRPEWWPLAIFEWLVLITVLLWAALVSVIQLRAESRRRTPTAPAHAAVRT